MTSETAGCGRKLSARKLEDVFAHEREIWSFGNDSGAVPGENDLAMTIDTGHMIGNSYVDFGELAVLHALGDIHAGRSIGISCAISVGLSSADGDELQEIMHGIKSACDKEQMAIAKGHTTVGEVEPTVTCSIIGKMLAATIWSGEERQLYLTKELGASRLLKLATLDEDKAAASAAKRHMVRSHQQLVRATSDIPICFTDVSGFGLAGALWFASKSSNLRYRLTLDERVRLDGQYKDVNAMCDYRGNERDFSGFVRAERGRDLTLSLYGQEYCGPMIAFVLGHLASEFEQRCVSAGFQPIKIGTAWAAKTSERGLIEVEAND